MSSGNGSIPSLDWPLGQQRDFGAALFDSDGVLVDSGEGITVAWREWYREYQPPGITVEELLARQSGRRPVDLVREICDATQADWDERKIQTSADRLLELQGESAALATIRAMPGAERLLGALVEAEAKWGVVTSAPRWLAIKRLEAAGLPIPAAFVTGDEVTHGKPHPEPFQRGAELLGVPVTRCVGFEDAAKGVESIKNAGYGAAVALETTETSLLLDRAGADAIVPNLAYVHARPGRNGAIALHTTRQITHEPRPRRVIRSAVNMRGAPASMGGRRGSTAR